MSDYGADDGRFTHWSTDAVDGPVARRVQSKTNHEVAETQIRLANGNTEMQRDVVRLLRDYGGQRNSRVRRNSISMRKSVYVRGEIDIMDHCTYPYCRYKGTSHPTAILRQTKKPADSERKSKTGMVRRKTASGISWGV